MTTWTFHLWSSGRRQRQPAAVNISFLAFTWKSFAQGCKVQLCYILWKEWSNLCFGQVHKIELLFHTGKFCSLNFALLNSKICTNLLHNRTYTRLFHPCKTPRSYTGFQGIHQCLYRTAFQYILVRTHRYNCQEHCDTKHYWNMAMKCTHQYHLHSWIHGNLACMCRCSYLPSLGMWHCWNKVALYSHQCWSDIVWQCIQVGKCTRSRWWGQYRLNCVGRGWNHTH